MSDEPQAPDVLGVSGLPSTRRDRKEAGRPDDVGQNVLGSGEGAGAHDLKSAVALMAGTAQP